MNRPYLVIAAFLAILTISSCSKRYHPSGSETYYPGKPTDIKVTESSSTGNTIETKTVRPTTVKTATPKVIVVNDKVAKRSVDGRYYYDLDGHRYWRNNKDGKYYLFNKAMYQDDAFKSPAKQ